MQNVDAYSNGASASAIPAGWYQDPVDLSQVRWWDGCQWTDHVQPVPQQPALAGCPAHVPVFTPDRAVYAAYPATPARTEVGSQRFQLRLFKVTSMIVLTQRGSMVHSGTYEQLEKSYKSVLAHNLLLGWWGVPFGLIWTPISLINNAKAWKQIRQMAGH